MPASRLLSEQGLFVDEEKEVDSETSNGKKKKKTSRDKPTLPFHFRDEQAGVQRGEVSAIVIQPVCGGTTTQAPLLSFGYTQSHRRPVSPGHLSTRTNAVLK